MLRHSDIWRALDRLAHEHGLSASGLAKKAGLDPTTFNKSKRVTRDGKLRWPSTESLSKVLTATNSGIGEFVSYLGNDEAFGAYRNIPLIGLAQAGTSGFFDDAGYPVGAGWDEIPFPAVSDQDAYALEISGDSMEPVYRDGDRVLVSPHSAIRRGDRVVLRTKAGEVMAKVLLRQSARKVELRSLNPQHADRSVPIEDVDWIARILWASQ